MIGEPTSIPLLTPIRELASLSDDDRFVLAAGGDAHAQEWMAHRILGTVPDTAAALASADVWAQMATRRGHVLSIMTAAQLLAARGALAAQSDDRPNTVEFTARAIALFDLLAEQGEPYSTGVTESIFGRLKNEGLEDLLSAVLERAKELAACVANGSIRP